MFGRREKKYSAKKGIQQVNLLAHAKKPCKLSSGVLPGDWVLGSMDPVRLAAEGPRLLS
jgi:hypothetical protein